MVVVVVVVVVVFQYYVSVLFHTENIRQTIKVLIKLKVCFAFVSDKASKEAVGNDNNTFEKSRQVEMKTVPDIVLSKVYDEKEDRKIEMSMTDIGKC